MEDSSCDQKTGQSSGIALYGETNNSNAEFIKVRRVPMLQYGNVRQRGLGAANRPIGEHTDILPYLSAHGLLFIELICPRR